MAGGSERWGSSLYQGINIDIILKAPEHAMGWECKKRLHFQWPGENEMHWNKKPTGRRRSR